MKNLNLGLAIVMTALGVVSCSKDAPIIDNLEEENNVVLVQRTPLSPTQINAKINETIASREKFEWTNTDAHMIWSATVHGDQILTIGYGANDTDFTKENSNANAIKDLLIARIAAVEAGGQKKTSDFLIDEDDKLNIIDVKIEDLATVEDLLSQKGIRYIEPAGYRYLDHEVTAKSGAGCGYDSETLNSADYTTVAPGAKVPWTFYEHGIPSAWNYSTGAGVGIGVIDTGLTPNNSLMNGNFNDGYSSGRYVQKYGTYVDSWWPWSSRTDGVNDKCGHGTSMTSVATAPRNNNGMPVGVAYNANLISYRGTKNVLLDGYHEQKGVANALKALGNRSDVKIISMSIGHIFSVGRIEDAVRYANNRGKLIFAAGGTSTTFTNFVGVIFPASMDETVAVTGVTDANYYKECDICHKGSKIDFTVVMQRDGNGSRTTPVLSYYNGQTDYVGGSSVATATTAGIAALVWSRHPSWTKTQVLNRLKQSADFYPNKNSQYGYGNINALQAVQ
ncbi:S8 family serine peptidase [Kordia sp. YSTF-M3]|uniref:S8 family serine peptidase n=1 Tax=Kordia aestuariivivens TaxID=2759037 RepID=A0ABR7Q4R1_9FLAO|nr:S8 family serine peptidase [Kordia aestuariivivens]MBC8753498.1 S8 family serine peptidase [Kordia aestuariivivens]